MRFFLRLWSSPCSSGSASSSPTSNASDAASDQDSQAGTPDGGAPEGGVVGDGTASAVLNLRDPSADYNGSTGDVSAEPLVVLSGLAKPPSIQVQVSLGKSSSTPGTEIANILCQAYQSSAPKAGDACDIVISYERVGTGRWAVGEKGKGKGTIESFDGKTIRVTYSTVLESLPPGAKGTITATGQMTVPVTPP